MSGRKQTFIILVLVLILGLSPIAWGQPDTTAKAAGISKYSSSAKATPKVRWTRVTFNVSVENFAGAKKVRVWLPYPKSNAYQTISGLGIRGNYTKKGTYTDGIEGNRMLYAEWDNPKTKPSILFAFNLKRKEIIRKDFQGKEIGKVPASIWKRYVNSSSSMLVTNGKTKDIAYRVVAGKPTITAKAEAIYDYIVENYKRDDTIKGCGKGDVCNLLNSKAGKCADIHSVFVAMARSVGVPSREIFGTRPQKDKQGDMTGAYHCIAEFYMPGYGWVPVDASDVLKKMLKEKRQLNDPEIQKARNYFFGAQNENYVAFSQGRDLTLNPKQSGGKLNYFMYPYAEVDGKALDYLNQQDLKYTVTYKDI